MNASRRTSRAAPETAAVSRAGPCSRARPYPPDHEMPAMLIGFSPALIRPSGRSTCAPTMATSASVCGLQQALQTVLGRHGVRIQKEQPLPFGFPSREIGRARVAEVEAWVYSPHDWQRVDRLPNARTILPAGSLSTTITSIGASVCPSKLSTARALAAGSAKDTITAVMAALMSIDKYAEMSSRVAWSIAFLALTRPWESSRREHTVLISRGRSRV